MTAATRGQAARARQAGGAASPENEASQAMQPITHVEDVPEAMTDEEAAGFYATHELTRDALAAMPDVSDQFAGGVVRTRPISIRLPEWMLAELKALASAKGVAYQALIKLWLDQRLQTERERNGRLASPRRRGAVSGQD